MAAGLGYKEFSTGDVLTAADANGYLASQVVMVFASAAARTSAIASPQEGMISYLKDTNSTEYYSGSAWVAIAGASSSGLVLITATPFTASTAVNVDSVFSATYKNYRIVLSLTDNTSEDIRMRLRAGGTTYTGSTYEQRGYQSAGGGLTNVVLSTQAQWFIGKDPTSRFGCSIDVYNPFTTSYTGMNSTSVGLASGTGATGVGTNSWIDSSRSDDGFTIYGSSSGQLTGIVTVYGYKE
jgi:hypothetical protein